MTRPKSTKNTRTTSTKTNRTRLEEAYNLALQADDEVRVVVADLRRRDRRPDADGQLEQALIVAQLTQALLEQAAANMALLLAHPRLDPAPPPAAV